MHNAAKRNLVLTTVSSLDCLGGTYQAVEHGELYQHITRALIRGAYKKQLVNVGNELIAYADHAIGLRQADVVEQISGILSNASLPSEYHNIGQYYRALNIKPIGSRAIIGMLERVAESPKTPLIYRARALQAIGGNYLSSGNSTDALRFFLEAGHLAQPKNGNDMLTATLSQWMVAVIQSINGNHQGSLEVLKKLAPFVRLITTAHPQYYFTYANALAVELVELGRIEAAQKASSIALAFPFAHKYPEFSETAKDISQKMRRASHSIVAISRGRSDLDSPSTAAIEAETSVTSVIPIGRDFFETDHHLKLDEDAGFDAQTANGTGKIGASSRSLNFKEPVSLLPFPDRFAFSLDSEKAVRPSSINALHFFRMSVGQKRSLVMEVAREGRTSGDILDNMLKAAGVIGVDDDERPVYSPNTINLERRGCLEELISLWVEGEISPDEFAAVISALRDCKDTFRLHNILDQMISLSFRSTSERVEAEDKWRRVIETNLKTDLENEAALREKISLWIQGEINPEDFAAVLYALRGCPDDKRRNQVFDKMISYAYHQIQRPLEKEGEWRKRVEASLESQQEQN